MDCSPPGSSVHGVLQARILEWVACPPPGDLPDPGIEPMSPVVPALQADSFPLSHKRSPHSKPANTYCSSPGGHRLKFFTILTKYKHHNSPEKNQGELRGRDSLWSRPWILRNERMGWDMDIDKHGTSTESSKCSRGSRVESKRNKGRACMRSMCESFENYEALQILLKWKSKFTVCKA